jgi:hypothetical protein
MKKIGLVFVVMIVLGAMGYAGEALGQGEGFQVPSDNNTYVVTYDLHGLRCVQGVGTPTQCAVENQAADEGGYPWTKVKCKPGDQSVHTFAWSLSNNQAVGIFEAPPALISSAKIYRIDVRLGRTCMKTAPK